MSLASLLGGAESSVKEEVKPEMATSSISDDMLKKELQKERLRQAKAAKPIIRGVSFAPSMLTFKFCKRLKIGQLAGLVDMYYEKATTQAQRGFDLGNALHDMVQSQFWDAGLLKGDFHCLKCDKTYKALVSPNACPSGTKSHSRKHLVFREVPLKNAEYLLSGRSDGIIVRDTESLLEIKSLEQKPYKNPNDRQFYFDSLVEGAKPAHVTQLMFYMLMSEIYEGDLYYINRNNGMVKSFHFEYDQSLIQSYLDDILHMKKTAEQLKEGKSVDLPPCCDDEMCQCHVVLSKIVV